MRVALTLCALALWLAALAPSAFADPPAHFRTAALDVSGLNKACGAAVDKNGDVYAASAGEGKVKVFDAANHTTPIAEIANANTPCALAVTTTGNLYVSESATGNVVRYKPDAFPLTGAPVYGAAEPIHTGDAEGISVDPFDNRLYVAAGDQIAVYKADGTLEKADVLEGQLAEATGVAAYTNPNSLVANLRLNLAVADGAGDELRIYSGPTGATAFKLRKTITGVDHDDDPGTAEQEFSFGAAGAYVAVDRGNENTATKGCTQVQVGGVDQSCTQGHFFLHDAGNDVIDEFDATGELFLQLSAAGLSADAEPTQVAVERSGGANDGTLYAGSGAGAGAELLAFGPVLEPSRKHLTEPSEQFSKVLASARAVATDCEGNVYVAAQTTVHVYDPAGVKLTSFATPSATLDLAVDCSGNVYRVPTAATEMTYYAPSAYPPTGSTTYTLQPALVSGVSGLVGVAVNPANEHVFLAGDASFPSVMKEFGPPSESSKAEGECGAGLGLTTALVDIDVYGKNSNVYLTANPSIITGGVFYAVKCGKEAIDAELIREVQGGGGCPSGFWGANPRLAVDQSNGHFVEFTTSQPGATAREYDALGTCLAEFGTFSSNVAGHRVAIDNSCALHELTEATTPTCAATYPKNGTAYVAFDASNNTIQPFDVNAFGPLEYPPPPGKPPKAVTGKADGFGPGNATLRGTVNPRTSLLQECAFEYVTNAEFEADGFVGAEEVACAESPEEIGNGDEPVDVHADVEGLEIKTLYRFRLVTANEFADPLEEGIGDPETFILEPPAVVAKSALPIGYDEATLRGEVDPSGAETEYHFEYLTEAEYEENGNTFAGAQLTPVAELPASKGLIAVDASVTGLAEGTEYRFQLVAENAVGPAAKEGPTFETLERPAPQNCENSEYRAGFSAFLPDCRAYELVSPAQTLAPPGAFTGLTGGDRFFNSWFVAPRGAGGGESVAYRASVARSDGRYFRAERGEGAHPAGGWESEQSGLTLAQGTTVFNGKPGGVSADQRYWLHEVYIHVIPNELAFPIATYMRVPTGQASRDCAPEPKATFEASDPEAKFELVGCGALGTDPKAEGRYISAGGTHVIFTSEEELENDSPATGIAIYDREAGEASAEIVSVDPNGIPLPSPTYIASTEDGTAVVFRAAGTLYLRRLDKDETTVLAEESTYAGISEDGKRVFFIDDTYSPSIEDPMIAAGLFACDVEAGSCAGPEQDQEPLEIAQNSVFVNVSADGSHAFFLSEDAMPGVEPNEEGEEAEDGESNLYAWDGADTDFIAHLHPQDLLGFLREAGTENPTEDLLQWTNAIPGQHRLGGTYEAGRAASPTRSTPDGEVMVFQSHAQLTEYDNEGKGEVYRYAPASASGPQLVCASCSSSGAPHASPADALLQSTGDIISGDTLVPSVTDDGSAVFFESWDALVPEDANATLDVYQWKALGTEGPGGDTCESPSGCLALISTGQSEEPSYLFGMSADGEDVFFVTREELAGADIAASFSLYDARVLGGIPDPPARAPCEGDACQPPGSVPPLLPTPATTGAGNGNEKAKPPRRCAKGKHRVKGRCVKKSKRKRHSKRQRGGHEGSTH